MAIRKWIDYKVIVTRDRMKNLAIIAWLLAVFATSPHIVMIVVGVNQNIQKIWHVGESVVGASCITAIGYFYIMIYLGVRKRKIEAISKVIALVKAEQEIKVAKTIGYQPLP